MRDCAASCHPAAPQAPARNSSPPALPAPSSPPRSPSLLTFNSHRKIKRPRIGDRKVYRPVRRHTLSRIDEAPQPPLRPRSKSLQHSTDFSSNHLIERSRSNVSADTSRSVPVCNQSYDTRRHSPQYAELRGYDSDSSYGRSSLSDLPIMIPIDPTLSRYLQYYQDRGPYAELNNSRMGHYIWRYNKKISKANSKNRNLYLAFMY